MSNTTLVVIVKKMIEIQRVLFKKNAFRKSVAVLGREGKGNLSYCRQGYYRINYFEKTFMTQCINLKI